MGNLVEHAKRELRAIGYNLEDKNEGPNKWMAKGVLQLLKVFSKQGHSGSSAPYCVELFRRLALFEPLGPLTGADDEWVEYSDGTFQNNRCSHVFKKNGKAYDINGIVFCDPNGACYISVKSRVSVKFPYTPKTRYVNVDKNGDRITKKRKTK